MIAAALALVGCGPSYDCHDPAAPLVDGLTCGEAQDVTDYVALLAGRPVAAGDQQLALGAVAARFQADPDATRRWLGDLRQAGAEVAAGRGLDGAEARTTRAWAANHGDDLIRAADGDLWNVQSRALSVWTKDDQEHIALTEADLEAWIHYASLCREAQGGGVLRISVADRVTVYKVLIDRFDTADRQTQIALAALGPMWAQIHDAWKAASYDTQQAWIAAAPLPPPMTATSLGYAEAIFESDVVRHVAVLNQVLGPFAAGSAERFAGAP